MDTEHDISRNSLRISREDTDREDSVAEWLHGTTGLVREFLVEVLGCFIGILFTIAVCALVITSGTFFLHEVNLPEDQKNGSQQQNATSFQLVTQVSQQNGLRSTYQVNQPVANAKRVIDEPTFGMLLQGRVDGFHAAMFLIVAYVVGLIFQRLNPKLPDQKSLEKFLRTCTLKELEYLEVQELSEAPAYMFKSESPVIYCYSGRGKRTIRWVWQRLLKLRPKQFRWLLLNFLDEYFPVEEGRLSRMRAAKIAKSDGAIFPYSHLRKYLESRRLDHLTYLAFWKGEKEWEGCSKMFINALKIRIRLVAPKKYGEVVRNEAHVRMLSSVWFAAKAIFSVLGASALPVIFAVAWRVLYTLNPFNPGKVQNNTPFLGHDLAIYLAMASFAAASAVWLKRSVESRFHYQRLKEIFYVFETANCLVEAGYTEILKGLPPENNRPR